MQAKGVVAMIPVALQPEPEDFDQKVRRKGLNWLKDKGIPANGPPPRATDLPSYWRKLDSPENNAMRSRRFHRYVKSKDAETLKELSPFIWYEAQRQGLL